MVSGLAVLANLLFCSLAAYPLARLRFAGRGLVLGLVVRMASALERRSGLQNNRILLRMQ